MFKPSVILEEVRKLIDEGVHSSIAIKIVSEKHDIRFENVKLVAVTGIPELYDQWCPNKRVRATKGRKRRKGDL